MNSFWLWVYIYMYTYIHFSLELHPQVDLKASVQVHIFWSSRVRAWLGIWKTLKKPQPWIVSKSDIYIYIILYIYYTYYIYILCIYILYIIYYILYIIYYILYIIYILYIYIILYSLGIFLVGWCHRTHHLGLTKPGEDARANLAAWGPQVVMNTPKPPWPNYFWNSPKPVIFKAWIGQLRKKRSIWENGR